MGKLVKWGKYDINPLSIAYITPIYETYNGEKFEYAIKFLSNHTLFLSNTNKEELVADRNLFIERINNNA